MPFSRARFEEIFAEEYPRETFETEAVYLDYRKTAWFWFNHGMNAAPLVEEGP